MTSSGSDPVPGGAILSASLQHRAGALAIDAAFSLTAPWTILFGPSGSGKTTILRALSGLLRPTSGHIVYRAQTLFDSTRGLSLAPHARPIRTATQTPRLFPHMTVRANILYGAAAHSLSKDATHLAEELATIFRIESLLDRTPRQLSGGEAQRVSVARAVLSAATTTDALLLLDEPFNGLDLSLRDHLVSTLRPWLALHRIPVLSVTHDLGEAFQLDAGILRIAEGRILKQGTAADVLAEERLRLLEHLNAHLNAHRTPHLPGPPDIMAQHGR